MTSEEHARMAALERAAKAALDDWDRNTCTHEDTHRGGFIWTICDVCERKWADDEGGFQPYSDPPGIASLRAALDALPSPQPQPVGETVEAWEDNNDGEIRLRRCSAQPPDWASFCWTRLGTVRLPITKGGEG